MNMKLINKKAFTLIELVAVITILGIILLIAVPIVTRAVRKSKLELMETQEDMLALIGKDFFLNNRYALPKNTGETSVVSIATLIKEGYTKEVKDFNKEDCNGFESYVEAIKLGKGKYNYHTYLKCKNYTTGDLWSDWSDWSEEEPPSGKDIEIESALFYNYEEVFDYWSDWGEWEDVSESKEVIQINQTIEIESQYRYKDQQWKWNNGGGREYAEGYHVSAPPGYPIQDPDQTSWTSWINGNATGSSTRQVQFRDLVRSYASEYYPSAPSGYPYQDTGTAKEQGRYRQGYGPWYYSCACWWVVNTVNDCGYINYTGPLQTYITGKYGHQLRRGNDWSGTYPTKQSTNKCNCLSTESGLTGYWGRLDENNRHFSACAAQMLQQHVPAGYTYYNGGAWIDVSSAPSGYEKYESRYVYRYYANVWGPWSATQTSGTYTKTDSRDVQYRDKTYRYYRETFETCGEENQYYSESPDPLCGYKDETDTVFTDWVVSSTLPESKDYRTIQRQTRTKIRNWSGPLLPSFVPLEEFESVMGKTLEEIEALETTRYITKTMYRYRRKVY
jgi:prepilin-type N-terminal cleavage/methylation domain-containing protein